jgi:hypothetical protein
MGHVFISYAEEDGDWARRIAIRVEQAGHSVYYFRDPNQRGKIIYDTIATEVKKARFFLSLLSPHYQSSPWCQAEFAAAFHLSMDAKEKGYDYSIFVLKVENVDQRELGFERIFDQFDLTGQNAESELENLFGKLTRMVKNAPSPSGTTAKTSSWLPFRNREKELEGIIKELVNPAGNHFHLVVAAPQMGKTRIIHHLLFEMARLGETDWRPQPVDLREATIDDRSNIVNLWSRFFQEGTRNAKTNLLPILTANAARQIIRSQRSWLLLLDSAELLSNETAKQLRELLGHTITKLEEQGLGDRLGFVAASRMTIRSLNGMIPSPEFHNSLLTEFKVNVIADALQDAGREMGLKHQRRFYNELAERVRRATEGLPALLVEYVEWIKREAFLFKPEHIESESLFRKIARPYIENSLLSAHALVPDWVEANEVEKARQALVQLILKTSVFRLVTTSHLNFLSRKDQELNAALEYLRESRRDPFDVFSNLPVVVPGEEPWRTTYTAIRRLLFRYQYGSNDKRAKAHQHAQAIYRDWHDLPPGTDKVHFLIEQLWHESEYVRLSRLPKGKSRINEFLNKLLDRKNLMGIDADKALFLDRQNLISAYTYKDILDSTYKIFQKDMELQSSLEGAGKGFSSKLLSLIDQRMEGTND